MAMNNDAYSFNTMMLKESYQHFADDIWKLVSGKLSYFLLKLHSLLQKILFSSLV